MGLHNVEFLKWYDLSSLVEMNFIDFTAWNICYWHSCTRIAMIDLKMLFLVPLLYTYIPSWRLLWTFAWTSPYIFLGLIKVKTWAKLLNTFCTTGKLELELIYKVQVQCYEDAKLMKLFPEIIRSLYDQDVLAEDTILHWFRKGTNPKGR